MSGGRLLVMLVILALGSAVLVGFVSRTPAAIRLTRPPPSAAASERGAEFTPAEVSRAGDFQGPAYLSTGLYFLITLVTLMWLARGPVG